MCFSLSLLHPYTHKACSQQASRHIGCRERCRLTFASAPCPLLCHSHFFNGYTWRLKLTVKPPDAGSTNDMNIHVGLCWGIELEGEGALALADSTMVQVRVLSSVASTFLNMYAKRRCRTHTHTRRRAHTPSLTNDCPLAGFCYCVRAAAGGL